MANYRERKTHSAQDFINPWKYALRLAGISVFIWVSLVGFGLLFQFDRRLGEGPPIPLFGNDGQMIHISFLVAILTLISILWAIILAIPPLISVVIVRKMQASSQESETQVRNFKKLSWASTGPLVFIATQLVALTLSLASIPQNSRVFFPEHSPMIRFARSTFNIFFSDIPIDTSRDWIKSFDREIPQVLLIALPSRLLARPELFVRLQRELGEPRKFFLDSDGFQAELNAIFSKVSALESHPWPHPKALQGATTKNRLSRNENPSNPEFIIHSAPEYLISKIAGIQGSIDTETANTSLTHLVRRHIAASQPQLAFLFRIGLFGKILEDWDFSLLVVDDTHNMSNFLKNAGKNKKTPVKILQLGELEEAMPNHPLAAMRWPKLNSGELEFYAKTLDIQLARGIGAVRDFHSLAVLVLPYPEIGGQSYRSWAFLRLPEGQKAKLANVDWLLPHDLQTVIQGLSSPENLSNEISAPKCIPIKVDISSLNSSNRDKLRQFYSMLWPLTRFNSNEQLALPLHLDFLPDLRVRPSIYCRNFNSSPNSDLRGSHASHGDWVISWKDPRVVEEISRNNLTNNGDSLRKKLFHLPVPPAEIERAKQQEKSGFPLAETFVDIYFIPSAFNERIKELNAQERELFLQTNRLQIEEHFLKLALAELEP